MEKRFTPSEVAVMCGVKVGTVHAWISRREIGSVKFGRRRFITLSQIQELYRNRQYSEFIDKTYAR
jgi:excisionase family DNA binding protein